jgi:threonine synthase
MILSTLVCADSDILGGAVQGTFDDCQDIVKALFNDLRCTRTAQRAQITVVGATSGDTGSATIYGLRGKENVECFILFPEGRVHACSAACTDARL